MRFRQDMWWGRRAVGPHRLLQFPFQDLDSRLSSRHGDLADCALQDVG